MRPVKSLLLVQTNPAQKMPPQLCMCLLKEVILTFLKDHLPLNREQRGRIDPTGPRQQHPAGKAQPGNPMEGAEATVKGAVLNASNDAAEEALAPGGGNGVQENTGWFPFLVINPSGYLMHYELVHLAF